MIDRRDGTRREQSVAALVGPRRAPPAACARARVEDISRRGLRLESARPLSPEETLVLYIGGFRQAVSAKVRWVRHRGDACVAGCRIADRPPEPRPSHEPPLAWSALSLFLGSMLLAAVALAALLASFFAGQ